MASNSSATAREHTPRTINSVTPINDVLRRRAESFVNDKSIDAESRAIIRYALEISDPILAELMQWADAGESIVDNLAAQDALENDSPERKAAALAEMIWRDDDPCTRAVALLVLTSVLESADDPKSVARATKHYAFTRCGELNVYGMVDVHIEMLERELFTHNSHLT